MTLDEYNEAYKRGFPRTAHFVQSLGDGKSGAEEVAQAAWSRAWERCNSALLRRVRCQ